MNERAKSKPRAKTSHRYFTEANVLAFKPKSKQYLVWDAWVGRKRGPDPARGLAILVSPSGAKSYRVVFYYPGSSKPHYLHLGSVGGMSLKDARARAKEVREDARKDEDPKANTPTQSDSFKAAVDSYIKHEQIGRLGNRSADETKVVMMINCSD